MSVNLVVTYEPAFPGNADALRRGFRPDCANALRHWFTQRRCTGPGVLEMT
jgi:hypothetical protein